MPNYLIQQEIKTLADIIKLSGFNNYTQNQFNLLDINFYYPGLDEINGWTSNKWLAETKIFAPNLNKAMGDFNEKMNKIIPRIGFISQCQIAYAYESFLVINQDYLEYCILSYTRDARPIGMMFGDKQIEATNKILSEKRIPEEFFLYWQNIPNVVGDAPKLLLMFAAVDAFIGTDNKKVMRKKIFGKELADELYHNDEINIKNAGLRHRLTHGAYINVSDYKYFDIVYKAIINYLNNYIFMTNIVDEDSKAVPRTFVGNKEEYKPIFLKNKKPGIFILNLVNVLKEFKEIAENDLDNKESDNLQIIQEEEGKKIYNLVAF